MMLRVRKRPGMEKEDVLKADNEEEEDDHHNADGDDYDEDGGGMWGMMFGSDKKKEKKKAVKAAPAPSSAALESPESSESPVDVINVFTIASGHMYERLQKIMFLSVVKNTKRCACFVCEGCFSGCARSMVCVGVRLCSRVMLLLEVLGMLCA